MCLTWKRAQSGGWRLHAHIDSTFDLNLPATPTSSRNQHPHFEVSSYAYVDDVLGHNHFNFFLLNVEKENRLSTYKNQY